jgi:protease-4
MRFLNVEGLYGKYGLRSEVIKSGDKKDIASSTRPMTDAEREILESVNRALFDRFRDAVRTHRKGMTPDDLARISDGRILTAEQAKELHMVDDIGHLDDAIAEARRLAGIKTSDVILYTPSHDHNSNIYAQAAARGDLILQSLNVILRRRGPTFLYLWSPGP